MSDPASGRVFHVQPWNPKTETVAQSIMDAVRQSAPELEVLFMGAAALRLPGKNDVDMDILCAVQDVPRYTGRLSALFGEPREQTDKIAAWSFYQDGVEVDIMLSDPKISHVSKQKRIFEALQNDSQLYESYRRLKLACDGLPYDEYVVRKNAFFRQLQDRRA